jgi:hypothetical protein
VTAAAEDWLVDDRGEPQASPVRRDTHVTLIQLLVQHRRVTVPILILAGGVALLIQVTSVPLFRASGTVMLASPAQDPSRVAESTVHLKRAVAELQGMDAHEDTAVGSAEWTAELSDDSTLHFSATAESRSSAERTVAAAIDRLERDLLDRQQTAGIPDADRLVGRLLTPRVVARQAGDRTYVADAVIWVDGVAGAEENPFTASQPTARLLALTLSAPEGRNAVQERVGSDVQFDLRYDGSGDLPTLDVTTQGGDQDEVVAAFDAITGLLDLELAGRQSRAQVPLSRRIFVDVLARPLVGIDTRPTLEPAAILALLLGVAGAAGAAGLQRRKLRRRNPRFEAWSPHAIGRLGAR